MQGIEEILMLMFVRKNTVMDDTKNKVKTIIDLPVCLIKNNNNNNNKKTTHKKKLNNNNKKTTTEFYTILGDKVLHLLMVIVDNIC